MDQTPPAADVAVGIASVPEVDRIWPSIANGLEDACRATGGDLTADYLWSECRAGHAFLVIASRRDEMLAASVWRFEKWTSGRKLCCLALYGHDMRAWLVPHRDMILEMAKAGQATAIVTTGRKGWERLFPNATVLRQTYEATI